MSLMESTSAQRVMSSGYRGPERRVHQMFVTRNTEYHLRAGVCVAVRDRQTEVWLDEHLALGRALGGGVRVLDNGEAIPAVDEPRIGDALYFRGGNRELVTSVLCQINRPAPELVQSYPTH